MTYWRVWVHVVNTAMRSGSPPEDVYPRQYLCAVKWPIDRAAMWYDWSPDKALLFADPGLAAAEVLRLEDDPTFVRVGVDEVTLAPGDPGVRALAF